MPRAIPGPSRLSGILENLTRQPRLELSHELTCLKLSHKIKNGDFGARYFVKEELPRIRYANPSLNIVVDKSGDPKAGREPTMTLEFANAPPKTFSLNNKWSTAILTELMSAAGAPLWHQWVEQRMKQSLPVVEDAKPRAPNVLKQSTKPKNMHGETRQSKGNNVQGKDSAKELLGLGGETTKPAMESSASPTA